nr:TPA_asm: hypothetical protein [Denlac tricladivirus]
MATRDSARRSDLQEALNLLQSGAGSTLERSWPMMESVLERLDRLDSPAASQALLMPPPPPPSHVPLQQSASHNQKALLPSTSTVRLQPGIRFGTPIWRPTTPGSTLGHQSQNQTIRLVNIQGADRLAGQSHPINLSQERDQPGTSFQSSQPYEHQSTEQNLQSSWDPQSYLAPEGSPSYQPFSPQYLQDQGASDQSTLSLSTAPSSLTDLRAQVDSLGDFWNEYKRRDGNIREQMQMLSGLRGPEFASPPPPLASPTTSLRGLPPVDQFQREAEVQQAQSRNEYYEDQVASAYGTNPERVDRDHNQILPAAIADNMLRPITRSSSETSFMSLEKIAPQTRRSSMNSLSQISTPGNVEAAQYLNVGHGFDLFRDKQDFMATQPLMSGLNADRHSALTLLRGPQTLTNQGTAPLISSPANYMNATGQAKARRTQFLNAGRKASAPYDRSYSMGSNAARELAIDYASRPDSTVQSGMELVDVASHPLKRISSDSSLDSTGVAIGVKSPDGAKFRGVDAHSLSRALANASEISKKTNDAIFAGVNPNAAMITSGNEPTRLRKMPGREMMLRVPGNAYRFLKSKFTADAPLEQSVQYVDPVREQSFAKRVGQTVAHDALAEAAKGMLRWGAKNLGPKLLKVVGDAPAFSDQIVSTDKPNESRLKKIVGDAPETTHTLDSSEAGMEDAAVAQSKLRSYFGPTLALMLLGEAKITSSYAGEARSVEDLLRNVILESASVQWAFNTADLTTNAAIPGCAFIPDTCVYPMDGQGGWIYTRLFAPHWRVDFESATSCVPLMTTFSLDSLFAAIKSGGNMTAFTSVLRLNVSFFNSDTLSRLFAMINNVVMNQVDYGFVEPLLRLLLYVQTYYPIPGDELGQFFSHWGWRTNTPLTFNARSYWPWNASFTPPVNLNAKIVMRVVDYVDYVKHITGNDDNVNPWHPEFTKDRWWPTNRDEITSVAVIFIRNEEIPEAVPNFWTMISYMQYPFVALVTPTTYYYWNEATNTWVVCPVTNYPPVSMDYAPAATPVSNFVDIPGPFQRVLFVLTDNVMVNQFSMPHWMQGNNLMTTNNYVLARWPKNAAANAGNATVNYDFDMALIAPYLGTANGDVGVGIACAIRRWEENFGCASARSTAMRIAKMYTAVWGPPKTTLRSLNLGNVTYPAKTVGILVASRMSNPTAFYQPFVIPDNHQGAIVYQWMLAEDCAGNNSTHKGGVWSGDFSPAVRYDRKQFRTATATWTIGARNIVVDFMIMRGWLLINEEYQLVSMWNSLPGLSLCQREGGIMFAILVDFIYQACDISYPIKMLIWNRWNGDPGLFLETQVRYVLTGHTWPSLLEYFTTGIQFDVPRWLLRQVPVCSDIIPIVNATWMLQDYAQRTYTPYARVDQYTVSRYNPNVQYTDANIALGPGAVERGMAGHVFRMNDQVTFWDLALFYIQQMNSYNLMIRKLTMSFYPGGPDNNPHVMMWTNRNANVYQMPFNLMNPTCGLCFSLAYAAYNGGILVTGGASFRAYPIGYQPRSAYPEEGTELTMAFFVRLMRDAFESIKTNYNILVVPTSVVAFIQQDMPPNATMAHLFRSEPSLIDNF